MLGIRPAIAVIASALLALTGCATSEVSTIQEQKQATVKSAFPRTIHVPAGKTTKATELTLDKEPQRIAAVDYESAEVIASLGLSQKLVLAPEALTNPALGSHVEEFKKVEQKIPVVIDLKAETVIEQAPDLVIMSPRHGAENKIGAVLEQAGIPSLILPESWIDLQSVTANISLIGEATGSEQQAGELAQTLKDGLTPGKQATADSPKVLVLTNQAGRPFITAGNAFPLELLKLAGATDASELIGVKTTGPISAEQIVEAAPDGILLIDMNGSGERIFAELLSNPAVAALPGASQNHRMLITGRQVQALGLVSTLEGLSKLQDWVPTLI